MPYDFRGYLALAEQLAQEDVEAAHRSAISRAYYAVYHDASGFAAARNPRFRDLLGQHKRLWDEMKRREPTMATVAEVGEAPRYARSSADYDRPNPFTPEDSRQQARVSVVRARLALVEIDRLRTIQ